jgi:hypothetical protein
VQKVRQCEFFPGERGIGGVFPVDLGATDASAEANEVLVDLVAVVADTMTIKTACVGSPTHE